MLHLLPLFQALVERGLIYSLIVIAVYVTSRIIKFDDLTVEGSFGLGGALGALLLFVLPHPLIQLPIILIAGGLCGLATGLLHTKLNINNLISGIVVTTGLFSITLKIAGPNVTIMGAKTLFDLVPAALSEYKFLVVLFVLNAVILVALRWLMRTEVGFLIRTVGDNPHMLTIIGKNVHVYKVTALVIANMLTALSGALFVQYVGYFSIWANVGILISALASLILAELISHGLNGSLIIGSIIYQLVIALTFELQLAQEWNKLITAGLIVFLLLLKSTTKPHALRK
jgi:putative ABC transport system permease protein